MGRGMLRNAGKHEYFDDNGHARYVSGKASPSLFRHAASGSMEFMHGSKIVVSGVASFLRKLKKAIHLRQVQGKGESNFCDQGAQTTGLSCCWEGSLSGRMAERISMATRDMLN